jgi:hypothetical protein
MGQFMSTPSSLRAQMKSIEKMPAKPIVEIFNKLVLDAPLAFQHRQSLLAAAPYIESDESMCAALTLFNDRFYDIDRQVSCDVNLAIAQFYVLYVRLLTDDRKENDPTTDSLLDFLMGKRREVIDRLDELKLKVDIGVDPAYKKVVSMMRASLTSCTAALYHKYGYEKAVDMYGPRPADPEFFVGL